MDKISTIKENILYFVEKQGIKKTDFYEKTEISASNFKGSGLKSEIGGDKIVKILSLFPEINPEWLLTGKGEMLREKISPLDLQNEVINFKELAQARLEIIDGLKFKLTTLEKEILELKQQDQDKSKSTPSMATFTGK